MCDQCKKWAAVECRCYACDRKGWAIDYALAWKKIKARMWENCEKLPCDTSTDPDTRKLLN